MTLFKIKILHDSKQFEVYSESIAMALAVANARMRFKGCVIMSVSKQKRFS